MTAAIFAYSSGARTQPGANQLVGAQAANNSYFSHPGTLSLSYAANGLNQYTRVGTDSSYAYDTQGNLASDGMRSFTYDIDNHLLTGSSPTSTTLTYDPLGRIWAQTVGATGTRLLFDGDELSTSYTSAGDITFRIVPSGLGVDSPLVWFSGSGVTTPTWLHTDMLGSIVAQSDSSGNASPATPYGYDPYGAPDTTNGFGGPPLKYTGQMSLPSLSLYYYKARDYHPNLGRFLQTDPAGYGSEIRPPYFMEMQAGERRRDASL